VSGGSSASRRLSLDRDRARALDVPGRELLLGAHVDEHDVAAREPLQQFLAADRVDVLAQVPATTVRPESPRRCLERRLAP
jgi:hypothetical protein